MGLSGHGWHKNECKKACLEVFENKLVVTITTAKWRSGVGGNSSKIAYSLHVGLWLI